MPDLIELHRLTNQQIDTKTTPLADRIEKNIPIYDCATLRSALVDEAQRTALKSELANILLNGAGVFVLKGAYPEPAPIDTATKAFKEIIAKERQENGGGADHFAAAGANDRIWNSLEKLCRADPRTFIRYHCNPWIELAAEAWLGPGFQVTAQVNLVRPGGKAQEAHCDYHLGFMTAEQVQRYPAHTSNLSQQLTLQGAVAHCDMPAESGTTKLLPFSQKWPENYVAFRDRDVRKLFEDKHVQLPLNKGDLLFFSPGLLHGAGDNVTENIDRMANLLQISSAFGVPLENVNRKNMCRLVYPALLQSNLSDAEKRTAIASTGDGYAFPINLDSDPPVGGLAPATQQDLMRQGLRENWSAAEFNAALDDREAKRIA